MVDDMPAAKHCRVQRRHRIGLNPTLRRLRSASRDPRLARSGRALRCAGCPTVLARQTRHRTGIVSTCCAEIGHAPSGGSSAGGDRRHSETTPSARDRCSRPALRRMPVPTQRERTKSCLVDAVERCGRDDREATANRRPIDVPSKEGGSAPSTPCGTALSSALQEAATDGRSALAGYVHDAVVGDATRRRADRGRRRLPPRVSTTCAKKSDTFA